MLSFTSSHVPSNTSKFSSLLRPLPPQAMIHFPGNKNGPPSWLDSSKNTTHFVLFKITSFPSIKTGKWSLLHWCFKDQPVTHTLWFTPFLHPFHSRVFPAMTLVLSDSELFYLWVSSMKLACLFYHLVRWVCLNFSTCYIWKFLWLF